MFDAGKRELSKYLDDPLIPKQRTSEPSFPSKIMNNPIVRMLSKINPLEWVIEAIMEEMPEVRMPSMKPLEKAMRTAVGGAINEEADILSRILDTLFAQFQGLNMEPTIPLDKVLTSLKSVVWTMFDTVRNRVEKTYDAMTAFVRNIGPVLEGV